MGVTASSLEDFFSDESELTVGEEVKIIVGRRRAYRLADVVKVIGVDGSDGQHDGAGVLVKLKGAPVGRATVDLNDVDDMDDMDDMADMDDEEGGEHGQRRGADAGSVEPSDAAKGAEGLEVVVSRDRIIAVGDVRITSYFVQESSKHAMAVFPGARVERASHLVNRIDDATLTHMAEFCASSECLTILDASTARPSTVVRKNFRAKLWDKYLESAKQAGLAPVGRTFFYDNWPADIKDAASERECICGCCYHCGTRTFVGMHHLCDKIVELFADVEDVADAVAGIKIRVDMTEEMFESEYYAHHALHSSSGAHCRTHALSAPFWGEHGAPCDAKLHLGKDGLPRSDEMPEFQDVLWDQKCVTCNTAGNVEKNWPMNCDCCDAVVHNREKCLGGESKIDLVKDEFKCRECVTKLAEQLHTMDCGQCNVRFDVIDSLGRLLKFLEGLGHAHSPDIERWMEKQLKDFETNLGQFAAHKMQDAHQSDAQHQELLALQPHQAQLIIDYAAKLKPARSAMTQTEGYGDKASISRHSITATFRPRASDYPEATDAELKEQFISVTYNLLCDDSEQNQLHALQGVNAALKLLNAQFPYITQGRITSDGANDYAAAVFLRGILMTDTTSSTGIEVLSHSHSIPGEGKAVNDMRNGQMNQSMKRLRARGRAGSSQTAGEAATAMDICGHAGVQNFVAEVERLEVNVQTPVGITKFYSKERVDNEKVRCRGFSHLGRGADICIPCDDADRVKLGALMATTSLAVSVDGSTSQGKVAIIETRKLRKQRRGEAAQAKLASRTAHAAAVAKRAIPVMRADVQAVLDAASAADILPCPTCTMRFKMKSKPSFERHVLQCGGRPVPQTMAERLSSRIGMAQAAAAERCIAALAIEITVNSQLELDQLGLCSEDDEEEGEDGSEEDLEEGEEGPSRRKCCIGVVTSGNAYVVTFAAPGAVLYTVSPAELSFWGDDGALDVFQFPVKLTFTPPARALLPRGWARKSARKAQQVLNEEQENFLQTEWEKDSKVASALLEEKMVKHFSGREELQLSEYDIQRWLNRTYSRVRAAEKVDKAELTEQRVHAAAAEETTAAASASGSASAAAGGPGTFSGDGGRAGGRGGPGGHGGRGGPSPVRESVQEREEVAEAPEPVAAEGETWTWWNWPRWTCCPCWPRATGGGGA